MTKLRWPRWVAAPLLHGRRVDWLRNVEGAGRACLQVDLGVAAGAEPQDQP
jgi:hypothetical protein